MLVFPLAIMIFMQAINMIVSHTGFYHDVMQAIMMGCQSRGGSPMSDAGYATSAGTHSLGFCDYGISWYPYSGTNIKMSDILAFNFVLNNLAASALKSSIDPD
jgi:hypothetical protein